MTDTMASVRACGIKITLLDDQPYAYETGQTVPQGGLTFSELLAAWQAMP
jgi:hypothetical protein